MDISRGMHLPEPYQLLASSLSLPIVGQSALCLSLVREDPFSDMNLAGSPSSENGRERKIQPPM